ncbi:MAG: hypothetical protein K8J31_22810 [Anaerolineae bacterium]|nr:hypothetical protein [Anaerolineae bacterium]
MPSNWTTPITWNVDQLVTNTDLNEQVRDNLDYLLSPNHARIVRDNGGNYTITNVTTFQDIDSTNLSITIQTHGGPVLVHFQATGWTAGTAHDVYFDLAVDGFRVGTAFTQGLGTHIGDGSQRQVITLLLLLTDLSAGVYTLRPQWRTAPTDIATLYADSTRNPVIFEAIEL